MSRDTGTSAFVSADDAANVAANGHEVSSCGRISQAVRDAYDAVH
jgi:hypothetical protein